MTVNKVADSDSMTLGVILLLVFLGFSLLRFCKETVSLCSWII